MAKPKKLKPKGFIAICQCGVCIEAVDITRTPLKEAGKVISRWLVVEGCTVFPFFTGNWPKKFGRCRCDEEGEE